jgi:hypothetical protein
MTTRASSFPASYDDIAKFELLNKVCIDVYIINEEGKLDKEREGNIDYIQNDIIYPAQSRAGGAVSLHVHQAH